MRMLSEIVREVRGRRKGLVVAGGNAPTVIESIARAVDDGFVDATLVGDRNEILALAETHSVNPTSWRIVDERNSSAMARRAVELIRSGDADILMKGLISTAEYTRAILDKKNGLVPGGGLLTHVTVIQAPSYHKLLIASDVAILVQPDVRQKIAMLGYCIEVARALGITEPKAGIISCVEQTSFKIDSTVEASIIKKMTQRGQISGALVDGPLAIDLAVSKRCADEKRFESPVAGDCDILIFPDICAANVFFKTLTNLGGASIAAVVVGASVPCVLTSRADTEESKYLSMALAALLADKQEKKDARRNR